MKDDRLFGLDGLTEDEINCLSEVIEEVNSDRQKLRALRKELRNSGILPIPYFNPKE